MDALCAQHSIQRPQHSEMHKVTKALGFTGVNVHFGRKEQQSPMLFSLSYPASRSASIYLPQPS